MKRNKQGVNMFIFGSLAGAWAHFFLKCLEHGAQEGAVGNEAVSEWQRMAFCLGLEDRQVSGAGACSECSDLCGSQLPLTGWWSLRGLTSSRFPLNVVNFSSRRSYKGTRLLP